MKYLVLFLSLILTLLVFSMSFATGTDSGSLSLGITNFVYNITCDLFPNNHIDIANLHIFIRKAAHVFEYMVLAISWFITAKKWNLTFSIVLIIGLLISSTDEIIQIYIADRGPSIVDAIVFDYLPFILMSSLLLLINNRKGENAMASTTLTRLKNNSITPKIAYNELFKKEKRTRIPIFKRAHFIKLRIKIPGEKGVNRFLRVLFFLPFPILLLRIILGFVKIDKYSEDVPLTKREIINLVAHRGVKVIVNTHSGEQILIKTI
ncbi:VanZ family protein [Mycoplasmatota bacterium WC30]